MRCFRNWRTNTKSGQSKLRPRDYQLSAIAAIDKSFETDKSTLIVLATGTGKTVVFSHVCDHRRLRGRCMVLAHREELIYQAAQKIEAVTGIRPDIEMASRYAYEHNHFMGRNQIVVSSIQTQISGKNGGRMKRFNPHDFSLLVVDEAHHAPAESYRRAIEYYRQNPELRVLGVTATPDRADSLALGKVFESVAFVYDIRDAVNDGWLVPIQQQFIQCEHLDYSEIKTTAGDLNAGELSELLEAERSLHEMVDPAIQIADGRKMLFFAVSVAQAERTCDIFNRHRPDSARCIFGHTPKDVRRGILADFAARRFQVLVNVGVATEGFDDPTIEVVAIGRPTKSRALYTQMVGRGTRPVPGCVDGIELSEARRASIAASAKPTILVLDFAGNSGHHKLVTTVDILGGDGVYPPEAIKAAEEKIAESNGGMRTSEALKEAHWETQILAKLIKAQKLAAIKARAAFRSEEVDPFGQPTAMAKPPKYPPHWYFKKATQKQLVLLERYGVDASEMTIADASNQIDAIARNGWKRVRAG